MDVRPHHSDRLGYTQQLIHNYGLDLPDEQLANLKRAFASQGDRSSNSRTITGALQFYDPLMRQIQTAQYWTMPNREAFDEFVLAELKSRGIDGAVDGLGESKVHFPRTPEIDGKWHLETWARYDAGVCIQGISKSVHSVRLDGVKEWLKAAKGKHQHILVQVDAIPTELRDSVLKGIRKQADTRLQRRDGEPTIDYAVRRAIGDENFRLLRSAATELRSFSLSTEQPSVENGDWALDVAIVTKPKTRIRNLLSQLVLRRPSLSINPKTDTMAHGQVSIAVPPELKALATKLLSAYPKEQRPDILVDALETIATGRLEAAVAVSGDETKPGAVGAIRFAGSTETLASLLDSDSLVDGQFRESAGDFFGLEDLRAYQMSMRLQEGLLWAKFAENPEKTPLDFLVTEPKRVPAPLLQFELDLDKWGGCATEGTPSNRLIRRLESLTDRYHRWSREAAVRKQVMASDMPDTAKPLMVRTLARNLKIPNELTADFESVSHKIGRAGNWRANGRISFSKNTLRLQVRVGRDLYGLYQVRGLLAAARALRSTN